MITELLSKIRFGAINDTCDPVDPGALNDFFGFKPWFHYFDGKEDAFGKCIPQVFEKNAAGSTNFNDIWLIALALIDDALKIAALVAIGFVIYGGIEMIVSNGNPEQISKGRNTVINALVGLFIAILASGIVSFLGVRLGA